jgi:hypothetical protein
VSDRDGLVALRDLLASSLVEADVPLRAALARELRATLSDLRALDAAAPSDRRSVLDEIAARRAARRPGAEDRGGAAESVVGGSGGG